MWHTLAHIIAAISPLSEIHCKTVVGQTGEGEVQTPLQAKNSRGTLRTGSVSQSNLSQRVVARAKQNRQQRVNQ